MTSHAQSLQIAAAGATVRFVSRLAAALSALAEALMTELLRRRAIRELSRLDDHMLADIGLERDQIDAAARFGRDAIVIRMTGG